ncbi:DUF2306 domain-containing protein [Pseudorhodobacter ferrugineus]|uniref:DUF2306 domain-containing protein n=1 Tax=Pseudorhodobacter ferrugineus TaxID=77008 RepID=UPI0003B4A3E6|nr:DUF2306 domain-containing protein [Pseudorhodobacter ferrugineus]
MSLSPILSAPFVIQLHALAAVLAVVIGPFVLLRRSRDIWHKGFGYVWVIAMGLTALTSFGITAQIGPGPISPIHVLSVFTVWSLWNGVNAARQRRIKAHQKNMQSLYFWALGIAGLFTFLPGRRMNTALFGESSMAGFLVMAGVIAAGLAWYLYASQKAAARG